jgi:hypothetical protein
MTASTNVGSRGNGKAYLLHRIQRDRPEIYQQFLNGEFRSIRAAATAAGISNANVLCALRHHWKRAKQAQRAVPVRSLR